MMAACIPVSFYHVRLVLGSLVARANFKRKFNSITLHEYVIYDTIEKESDMNGAVRCLDILYAFHTNSY